MIHKNNSTKKDESEQLQTESKLQFANFLNEIVACFDTKLRHTYVNAAVERFTGRPASDFIGKTNHELGMPGELVKQWDRELGEVIRSGNPSEIQFKFASPEGEQLFRSQLLPQTDAGGSVTSVMTVARNVGHESLDRVTIEHFKSIIESSDDAIIGRTIDGVVTSWNRGAEVIFGYSQKEMLGRSLLVLFPEDRKNEELFLVEKLLLGEKVDHFETVRVHKDGNPVHVSVSISPIRNAAGDIVGASKVARDITQTKQQDLALREREQRLTRVLEGSEQGYWDWNVLTNDLTVSERWETMLGYARGEMNVSKGQWTQVVHPEDLEPTMTKVGQHLRGETAKFEGKFRCKTKSGDWLWVLSRGRVIERDAQGQALTMSGTHTDITAQMGLEVALRASVAEKTALLMEVHHRVKNNLQVITSLLRLEASRCAQPDTKAVLGDMQSRIRAMALLHESLYRSGTFASVDLGHYLRQLSTQAFQAQSMLAGAVELRLHLGSVPVSMEQAIPCGLLVNELISNCLKHAFPNGDTGCVSIDLRPVDERQQWCLCVSDTGVGLPENFEEKLKNSLGLQLVGDLALQIGGELTISPNQEKGASFTVNFQALEPAALVMPA